MKLVLTHQPATCPYRLLDDAGYEIAWANDFLDAQHLRQLSPRSLRAYAYDLLHFTRWFQGQSQALSEITESTLLDYVRHQLSQQPQPALGFRIGFNMSFSTTSTSFIRSFGSK